MTEPERPPKDFLNWLDENYNWNESNSWRTSHLWGEQWKTDPIYQYWRSYTDEGQLEEFKQYLITNYGATREDADTYLADITDDPNWRNIIYATYPDIKLGGEDYLDYLGVTPEVREYLGKYTSNQDLADRILGIKDIDQATKNNIYQNIVGTETPEGLAIRQATGRVATEQEKALQSRLERGQELAQALNYTFNNPLVSQNDLQGITKEAGESYLKGETDAFIRNLETINARAEEKAKGEEQTGKAMLQGLSELSSHPAAGFQRAEMPEVEGIINTFLKGTGYGEGTKLRSFIESEIPTVYEETAKARKSWWERMNPAPEATYESEKGRLESEAARWKAIGQTAPTSAYTSDTYWGEGGLANIAQQAYAATQKNLGKLRPEDFGEPQVITKEEDPLTKALRERDWIARYYRRPNTGLVSRLTPSVRF